MTTTIPALPALVPGRLRHVRRHPIRDGFEYGIYAWLVDLDDLPRLPRPLRALATFRAGDHIGDPMLSLRANVEAACAEHGHDVTGDRIVMLANARSLGYVFDPISVFWCLRADGSLRCIVAEVHNTYGGRHAYVTELDDHDSARIPKEFYVSPFFTVDGVYDLRCSIDDGQVRLVIRLEQDGRPVFVASFRGDVKPLSPGRLIRTCLRYPLLTYRIALLIRWRGVRLWLRRLPVVPRRTTDASDSPKEFAS